MMPRSRAHPAGSRARLPWLLVLVVAATMIAVTPGDAVRTSSAPLPPRTTDAQVPTHEVGDKVGFGATTDLGALAEPYLNQIRALDAADDNFTIHNIALTGASDIWVTTEVVGKTADRYAIQTDSANGLRLHYLLDATSTQLPRAGIYAGDTSTGSCMPPSAFGTTTARTSVDLQIDYLEAASGESNWTISDFSVLNQRKATSFDLRGTATLRNFPMVDVDLTACRFTVTYDDADVTLTVDADTVIRTVYNPALDVFDFPIANGESWPANATLTQGGTIRGTIDLTGIDPEDEEALFDGLNEAFTELGIRVSGLDGFPITLEGITVLVGATAYLEDGVIHDLPGSVDVQLRARETDMTLSDGEFHTVYLISEDSSGVYPNPCSWVYSPDHGFVVGLVCEALPGVTIFELENVPANEAEQEVADTQQQYRVFGAAANPLADFFLKPPFFGILLIAAIAIIVIALLVRRRGKAGMAPPPSPPQMPPQGGAPPGSP